MTQDEIIEMAREAEINYREISDEFATGNGDGVEIEQMQAFAKLVAAKERKEICGTVQQIVPITSWAHELLDAIRARGEA
jgi:hypothetical protein